MADYKAFLIALVMIFLLFTLWGLSFEKNVRSTKRKLYGATTIPIAVIIYSLQSVSKLIEKLMQQCTKPPVPRPNLPLLRKLRFVGKSPAPWNLAILILVYITLAIYQKHIREEYSFM